MISSSSRRSAASASRRSAWTFCSTGAGRPLAAPSSVSSDSSDHSAHARRTAGVPPKSASARARVTVDTSRSASGGRPVQASSGRGVSVTASPIAVRRASNPTPFEATVGTTLAPSQPASRPVSKSAPAASASSIMLRATMTGMPVSAICSTRYSARSMTPASTTTTTASGGPSCRPSTASTATCSSGELAVKL